MATWGWLIESQVKNVQVYGINKQTGTKSVFFYKCPLLEVNLYIIVVNIRLMQIGHLDWLVFAYLMPESMADLTEGPSILI